MRTLGDNSYSMTTWVKLRSLPLLVTSKNKLLAGFLMFFCATILYMTSNHYQIFEPIYLPMMWIDDQVPFLPYSVWIYISEYVFFVVIYLMCKSTINLNKYLYSFFALQTVSVAIFWIWPTTYPRDLYPLPQDLHWLTRFVFESLRVTDAPTNCCPSLHVSSVYLTSFLFVEEQKEKFPFFFTWGTLIALSTLTTKQHYAVDVLAGLAMALIFYWLFYRVFTYKSPEAKALQI